MKWMIAADSSCDLAIEGLQVPEGTNFSTVPLSVLVGDREFVDDEKLDVREQWQALKAHQGKTSSACPAPELWAEKFRQADYSIAVTMTSALSGTYNSALVAKEMVLEEFPNKKIHVIDTRSTAGHMVILCKKISSLIGEGMEFEEVCRQADVCNKETRLLFTLQSYETLVKNGRMNKFVGMVATKMNIRAVGRATEAGELGMLTKERGEARAFQALVKQMAKLKSMENLDVYIHHCMNEQGADMVAELVKVHYPTCRPHIFPCRGLTSYYAENGGILAGF